MENGEKNQIVSYIAFEGEMTRMERINHRLFVLCIALLVALLATNIGWIWYESQWEVYETQEVIQEADGNGNNNFVGGDYYGETDNQND